MEEIKILVLEYKRSGNKQESLFLVYYSLLIQILMSLVGFRFKQYGSTTF